MCGAKLEEEALEVAAPPPIAPTRKLTPKQFIILGSVAAFILIASIILGWNLSQGNIGPEPPTMTPTITSSPTTTPSPTATLEPTFTPTIQPTPTPIPPQNYIVKSGDTLLEIAMNNDMTVEELMAYNALDSDIIVADQTLLLPPPTPTPGPTPTPKPGEPTQTPSPYTLYTVKRGDVLSTIAQDYNVSLAELKGVNSIPADSETIQVGQVLMIPQHTPTPENDAIVSSTPQARSAYPAPTMLYPPNGAAFDGADAVLVLQWASVGILEDQEYYQVELIVPTTDGKFTETYYLRATAWRLSEDFFPAAELDERAFEWRVNIVREITTGASPEYDIIIQSERRRTFTWNNTEF